MSKVLVLISGGLDSTVALAKAVKEFRKDNVTGLSIFYGQKHSKELSAVQNIVDYYGIEHARLDLSQVFTFSNSTLLDGRAEISKGDYELQLKENPVISTYVPFRNGLFISAAASVALSKNCTEIWYGAHKGDSNSDVYPDCSKEFLDAMNTSIHLGSGKKLTLIAPFIDAVKGDIVSLGIKLKVPFELTWSCYNGLNEPCGECATCIDRENAFRINKISDPLTTKK